MRATYWMGLCLAAAVAVPASAQAPNAPAPAAAAGDRMKAMFDRLDTDHDGYISRDEANAAREAMRARMQERRTTARDKAFAKLDANGDGSVSRSEFDSAPRVAGRGGGRPGPGRPGAGGGGGGFTAMFDMMDADHDGRVSFAEAQAAMQQRMAMRGQRHPAPAATGDPASGRPLGEGRN